MKFRIGTALGILMLALALVPTTTQGQPDSIFGEQIEVRVVNLEVVVTDRQGNRVSGLNADDFSLRVDGESVPVRFFSEISEGQRLERVATLEDQPTTETQLNPTGAEPGQSVGTSYLVFIDNFFAPRARDRNQVLQGIAEEIPRLGPNDKMAVVSFNGRNLNMLSPWSSSGSQLEHAFTLAQGEGTAGLRTGSVISDLDNVTVFDSYNAESSQGPAGVPELQGGNSLTASTPDSRANAAAQRLESQLKRVTLGVTATMRSFSQVQGRKVMLVLSGGWPPSVCDYLLGPRNPIANGGECVEQGPKLLRPIYEIANLLGYTLYPIDVPTNRMDIDASESDDIALARNGPGLAGGSLNTVSTNFRESELHATLRKLANETGGKAMINETRLASLESVIDDTRSYYWLGFSPEWRGDDKNRKIKLEVNKPGLEVRYREGFRDLSRSEEVDFMVESTLLFGPLPGSGRLGIRMGEIPKRGRKVTVPMSVVIPMDSISMLPLQGRYIAELELRIAALDEYGDRNEIAAVPVRLEGDAEPPKGAHAVYDLQIKIKRQPQDLVVSLYDPISDHMLVAKSQFAP